MANLEGFYHKKYLKTEKFLIFINRNKNIVENSSLGDKYYGVNEKLNQLKSSHLN